MRSRRRFGFGRKMLQAASVFAIVLSGASFASADAGDSHSVAYEVVSFRYLNLGSRNGEGCPQDASGTPTGSPSADESALGGSGCAVKFPILRGGDAAEASGGTLSYATSLSGDKIEVKLDSAVGDGLGLGVFVSGTLTPGAPCYSGVGLVGTVATGTETPLVSGGQLVSDGARSPVALGSTAVTFISDIDNCGATGSPVEAALYYVLDARSAAPTPDDSTVSAVKVVTYTLKAG